VITTNTKSKTKTAGYIKTLEQSQC